MSIRRRIFSPARPVKAADSRSPRYIDAFDAFNAFDGWAARLYFLDVLETTRVEAAGKVGDVLLSRCANPDCASLFDYRQGRLFRVQRARPGRGSARKSHFVKHFWLCKECAETYTVEYVKGSGMKMVPRFKRPAVRDCPVV